jgi:hypothetical protein
VSRVGKERSGGVERVDNQEVTACFKDMSRDFL